MKKTVLITGVAGLIGSRLADWIIANKPEFGVVGIDDLSGGYKENIHPEVKFYQYNINTEMDKVESVFKVFKPEYVFHFAAYAAEGLSPFIRSFNYQNNLVATSIITNNCIKYKVKRLVFTSSMAVYGNGKTPFNEDDQPNPIDPYGVAKYACEMDIQIAGEQHKLDWCIIRPHNVYGIKQNIWDKYRNVLGIWMYQYLNGEKLTIFGTGGQTRAFSFVDDCLEPIWKTAVQKNCSKQIINVGGTKSTTIKEACETLYGIMSPKKLDVKHADYIYSRELKYNIQYLEARHEVKDAHPAFNKSVSLLDYHDKTNLASGLRIMWEWAQQQPKRERFVWSSYEIDNQIYSFWK